jgi:hypothetical protein
MKTIHMILTLLMSSGERYVYISEGSYDEIGRITHVTCIRKDGTSVRMPTSGFIDEVCSTYPKYGVTNACLDFNQGQRLYRDETGQGIVTHAVSAIDKESLEKHLNTKMVDIVINLYHESGRTLFGIIGSNLCASEVDTITGSCGSSIKLMINGKERYKKVELLHAILPNGPGEVQMYSMGEDIVHVFTRGKGVLLRTVRERMAFESIDVEITSNNPWQMVVVPPREYYQVVNTSTDTELEYFWFFLDHNDAYNRGGVHPLSKEENERNGWRFVFRG